MGFIREPEGVDFVINSEAWTEEDSAAVSLYIKEYKLKKAKEKVQKTQKEKVATGVNNMGFIKEPEGVDFFINSGPLTDEDRAAISLFIKEDKLKRAKKKAQKSQKLRKKKVATEVS